MCQQQICPSKPISSCAHMRQLCHYIYLSYELHAISNVTTSIGKHTFHIIDKCPCTNMPSTCVYCP